MSGINSEELKALEDVLVKKSGALAEAVQKALKDEVDNFKTITGETNQKLTAAATQAKEASEAVAECKTRLLDLEQKGAGRPGGGNESKTIGDIFTESEQFKYAQSKSIGRVEPVKVGSFHKTAIVNQTGQNQTLVPDHRLPGLIMPALRRLTVRDLLPQLRTDSNLVQYAKELLFTNNAAVQFSSPNDRENVAKAESALTFELANAPVVTIAHWIPASRQILADAKGLSAYINARLIYGLKLAEEAQLLTGDGTGGNVSGLMTNATAFNRGVSNDTKLDTLLKATLQVALSEYSPDGFVLNPIDWTDIQLLKDTTGRYLFSDPHSMESPRVWGLPVVATQAMTATQFLVGAFALAAAIWDREDAEVRIAEQHDDFFIKNMVAILCEERLALTVFRGAALVKGTLPATGI